MGYLREVELDEPFQPFTALREYFGFVPKLWRAQTLLPRLIEAEAALASAILFEQRTLSQVLKERILLALAALHRNAHCIAAHYQMLRVFGVPESELDQITSGDPHVDLSAQESALLNFAVRLGVRGPSITGQDVAQVLSLGWSEESVLEAILVTGWGNFRCTLSTGVGAEPDFAPPQSWLDQPGRGQEAQGPSPVEEQWGPHLCLVQPGQQDPPPFAFFRETFGFIPNLFRAQVSLADVLGAEAAALGAVLLPEDALTRIQKERILLAVSAANQNTYCISLHSEMLSLLGIPLEDSYQVATDHRLSSLADADHALLDFALKVAEEPTAFSQQDVNALRQHGFNDEQVLDAVATTALTNLLNTVQMGLGAAPDFAPQRSYRRAPENKAHLSPARGRPTGEGQTVDPDSKLVGRAQRGDLDAFEALVQLHSKRAYRTLVGILGDVEEARDAMQDTFLKAFQHLANFQGRSKFGTWLLSIASNTGLQRLRERRPVESLDDGPEGDEGFRPRQIRAWTNDPEQVYSQAERRALVETSVMGLPAKYRVVVLLRDFEQLSTEEAAAALGIGVPALKSRLLRGRLLLREALAPHFAKDTEGVRA
jgi:RNA polymerase sigma-70 factor (ECF subfamily)